MPKTKVIYYVRHGESDANVAGVISGAELESVLTEAGRAQARRAGRDLKNKDINMIVASPMKRTLETAAIIAKEIGYEPAKIVESPLFIERKYGRYSNRPLQEYWDDLANDSVHEGVETTEAIFRRIKKGFDWLEQLDAQRIVLVSHGGVGRAVRAIVEGLHHSHMYKIDGFKNTEIYEFRL